MNKVTLFVWLVFLPLTATADYFLEEAAATCNLTPVATLKLIREQAWTISRRNCCEPPVLRCIREGKFTEEQFLDYSAASDELYYVEDELAAERHFREQEALYRLGLVPTIFPKRETARESAERHRLFVEGNRKALEQGFKNDN